MNPDSNQRLLLDKAAMAGAIRRLAVEICEKNKDAGQLALIGIHKRGVPLAHRLAAEIRLIPCVAILGQPEARFDMYQQQIRAEYAWVPEAVYRAKRAEILQGFLVRPFIYGTEPFRTKYEAAARRNLLRTKLDAS